MIAFLILFFHFISCLLLTSCSREETKNNPIRSSKGEYIYRQHDEHFLAIEPMQPVVIPSYPWEETKTGSYPKITKAHFRCRGSSMNPILKIEKGKDIITYCDCGGADRHSLPLRDGKEFIYPILIDLLNHIQTQTNKQVIITSGHRCPEHQNYIDPSPKGQSSKHQIGAEVRFYVNGADSDKIINIIQNYYKHTPKYQNQKEYLDFQRYQKPDVDVSTLPWFNKEIFVKFYKNSEGRDFDNSHTYPYFSIQVRYDFDLKEKVTVNWNTAHRNYMRK